MGVFDLFSFSNKLNGDMVDVRSLQETKLRNLLKNDCSDAPRRFSVRYSGTVQGVGFRWTMQMTAREQHLTGWVRNLDDGTVAAEVQGRPDAIVRLLEGMHDAYRGRSMPISRRIDLADYRELPLVENEADFSIH